ncbi:unnamed protein product [Closterium sp. NIES-64]|nr:unnamed protein product [Closterium sp. NIES-64]
MAEKAVVEDDDDDYEGVAEGTDDKDDEQEDRGMSPSDDEGDDDAEEKAHPVTPPPKRIPARGVAVDKGKGKAVAQMPRHEPWKKRSTASVERGMWTDKESTVFAAARWFTKDKLETPKGKQGAQYWVSLHTHIKESNPDWCRNVNAMWQQWRKLMAAWDEYKQADDGEGTGYVEKPPWWPYLELYNMDTAASAPHAVDGGTATNANAENVPSSSQPVTSTPTFTARTGT